MIHALCIVVGLLLLACVALVIVGARAIATMGAELERDRRVGYQFPVPPPAARPAPQWILVASGKAVRRV